MVMWGGGPERRPQHRLVNQGEVTDEYLSSLQASGEHVIGDGGFLLIKHEMLRYYK